MGRGEIPPEAVLIRERREAAIPRMSHKSAAERAQRLVDGSFSAGTWQKIEGGAYAGGPDRIAIMAMVVGVTPEELEEAGRPDAARMLRGLIERQAAKEPLLRGVDRETTSEAVVQLLLQGLEEIRRERRLSDAQKTALERQLIRSQLAHLEGQLDQIRTMLQIGEENGQ